MVRQTRTHIQGRKVSATILGFLKLYLKYHQTQLKHGEVTRSSLTSLLDWDYE